jgi:hypothetical protein
LFAYFGIAGKGQGTGVERVHERNLEGKSPPETELQYEHLRVIPCPNNTQTLLIIVDIADDPQLRRLAEISKPIRMSFLDLMRTKSRIPLNGGLVQSFAFCEI